MAIPGPEMADVTPDAVDLTTVEDADVAGVEGKVRDLIQKLGSKE